MAETVTYKSSRWLYCRLFILTLIGDIKFRVLFKIKKYILSIFYDQHIHVLLKFDVK